MKNVEKRTKRQQQYKWNKPINLIFVLIVYNIKKKKKSARLMIQEYLI